MIAFVDVGETLESMIPEWEHRVADSLASDARTELTLVLGHEYFRIRVNRGAVDVAAVPGRNKLTVSNEELVHLVTGYRPIGDLLDIARSVITQEARVLASTLFPARNPFVWKFDHF